MKINSIRFKNFGSYGNVPAEIDLKTEEFGLHLITGQNGAGKCVSGDTLIKLKIENKELLELFNNFVKKQIEKNHTDIKNSLNNINLSED
jgi:ABC-type Mn2+/Zn2+ transport system ATPase subunit